MSRLRVGVIAGFAAFVAAAPCFAAPAAGTPPVQAATAAHSVRPLPDRPMPLTGPLQDEPLPLATKFRRPWIEGVDPVVENRLFQATYATLPSHNVLKVYAFSANGYESAGIRFSARIPHEAADLTMAALAHEAVDLIRTTFARFPEIQQVDVWATIPVAEADETSVESTVFSVSADRATYERVAHRTDITDYGFLNAFGRVWVAPQVPR